MILDSPQVPGLQAGCLELYIVWAGLLRTGSPIRALSLNPLFRLHFNSNDMTSYCFSWLLQPPIPEIFPSSKGGDHFEEGSHSSQGDCWGRDGQPWPRHPSSEQTVQPQPGSLACYQLVAAAAASFPRVSIRLMLRIKQMQCSEYYTGG